MLVCGRRVKGNMWPESSDLRSIGYNCGRFYHGEKNHIKRDTLRVHDFNKQGTCHIVESDSEDLGKN